MKYTYAEYVPILKALSDETRLKIVDMLSCGELCACNILKSFNITQPTLSYHMKSLTESGAVNGRRQGAWMHYSLNAEKVNEVIAFLTEIKSNNQDCTCQNCKCDETECD